MPRSVSLGRTLLFLVLLAGTACQPKDGGSPAEPGGSPPTSRPGGDARVHGDGWIWTAPGPAWVGMPAADDSDIAFTYGHQHLVVLDAAGRLRWDVPRLGLRDVAPVLTSDLIVASTDDGLAAFRRSDGTKAWDTGVAQRTNSPVVAQGRAVTTTWEGAMVAFDLADGKVAWTIELGGPALGPPATDGVTAVATWDRADRRTGGAVAVDVSTGRRRWAVSLPGGGISAPVVTPEASAVVVAGDLAAHALAMTSGIARWKTDLEGAGSPEVPPLAVGSSAVLVAHRLGGLDLLDAATGRRTWKVATDGAAVRGGPIAGPEGVYALPLDDGRMVLAGPKRQPEFLRPPAGRVSGVASGPKGFLVSSMREAPVNTVEAGPAW